MNIQELVESLTFEQRESLLEYLLNSVDSCTTMPPHLFTTKPPSSGEQDFTMKRDVDNLKNNHREPVKAKANTWKDTGEDRNIETPQVEPTPRTRKPPKKIDVTCHVCGKTRKVNSSLVYGEYYRCESCSGNR